MYLLHLSFSPQKKKASNLFRLLENSFTDTSFWGSDIFNSDDAGALARSRSYLDLDRYLCGSFNDVDVLWNAARWKHNSGKDKNGKKSFWQRCVHRGCCISFILFDTSCEFERGWVRIIAASYYHSYYRDTGFMIWSLQSGCRKIPRCIFTVSFKENWKLVPYLVLLLFFA